MLIEQQSKQGTEEEVNEKNEMFPSSDEEQSHIENSTSNNDEELKDSETGE